MNNNMPEKHFFNYLVSILKIYMIFIIVTTLSCAFFSYIITKMLPKDYSSECTILFLTPSYSPLSLGMGGSFVLPSQTKGVEGNSIKQILESRTLITDVVKKTNLTEYFKASLPESVELLKKKIKITYYQFRMVLVLKVTMHDPELAANVANTFIESLEQLNRTLKISTEKNLVTVLDQAIPPEMPSGPSLKKNMLACSFIGFLLSYLLCFFWTLVRKEERSK